MLAGCGDVQGFGAEPTPTPTPGPTPAPTATPAPTPTPEPEPVLFTEPGPYAVGITTIELEDRDIEVWYPVDPQEVEGDETEQFDALSLFPEALQPLIPEGLTGVFDTGGHRDAPPSGAGPFPVVIYSHGLGGYRQAAMYLTSHLATWGFVVAAPDHVERGLVAVTQGTAEPATGQDVTDIANTVAALATGTLSDIAATGSVVVTGHSAGAATAARAAGAPFVDAFVAMAGGPIASIDGDVGVTAVFPRGVGAGTYTVEIVGIGENGAEIIVDGQTQAVPLDNLVVDVPSGGQLVLLTPDPAALVPGSLTVEVGAPDKPALVLIGERDAVVPAAASEALYGAIDAEKLLANIANSGHAAFADACPPIRDRGGLADLEALLGPEQLALVEDGCLEDFVDPLLVQDLVKHLHVAFLYDLFELGDTSGSFDADLSEAIGIELAEFRLDGF